jgi:hypothetical protein
LNGSISIQARQMAGGSTAWSRRACRDFGKWSWRNGQPGRSPRQLAAELGAATARTNGCVARTPRASGGSPDATGRWPVPVRLRRREDGAVEVRSCAVKNRAVWNRNCVAARRGGEQRNQNDQSVTQAVQLDRRRELDSVGVDGRVCWKKTKPVARA